MVAYILENNVLQETTNINILERLYYLEVHVPTDIDKDILKKNSKIVGKDIDKFIKKNKTAVTQLIGKGNILPLFDITVNNIQLVEKKNIYMKVIYEYNRFPYLELIQNNLKEVTSYIDKELKKDVPFKNELKLKEGQLHKLNLNLTFINELDLVLLNDIFINALYTSNPEIGDITFCQRQSFTPYFKHLKPFYRKEEIIKMGYNMGLLNKDIMIETYDDDFIAELCNKVMQNDISSDILLQHQQYIMKNRMYNLIQYFSLHGSYFMNKYLRNIEENDYKNKRLEESIILMNNLIRNAPAFNNNYILYRFIHDDFILSKIKIGELYIESGFSSTTRNPFYNPETWKFGTVILKIKIPKGIKGIGLILETISLFPSEEEIVLAPNAMLRLDAKNTDVNYHTLDKYKTFINTQYEFTLMGYEDTPLFTPKMPIDDIHINFLEIERIDTKTISEKINHFINKYVNDIYQFVTTIGTHDYVVNVEWYNSTGVYRDFYASKTANGFCMYAIRKGNILFMLEIGESEEPYIYVNYYRKLSTIQDLKTEIVEIDFLDFIAKIGFFFNISNIIIYCDYMACDYSDYDKNICTNNDNHLCKGGNYNIDIYQYLKYGKKRFGSINEIRPAFNYFKLDELEKIKPSSMISKKERYDEAYQYLKTIYKKDDNYKNFIVETIDNSCSYATKIIKKLKRHYTLEADNPFRHDYYIFNGAEYLYNRHKISYYPASHAKVKSISKNRNRLNEYTR